MCVYLRVKCSCKNSEGEGAGGASRLVPLTRNQDAGFSARQGAAELVIKTFYQKKKKKDLMFKGAAPEKR